MRTMCDVRCNFTPEIVCYIKKHTHIYIFRGFVLYASLNDWNELLCHIFWIDDVYINVFTNEKSIPMDSMDDPSIFKLDHQWAPSDRPQSAINGFFN